MGVESGIGSGVVSQRQPLGEGLKAGCGFTMRQYFDQVSVKLIVNMELNPPPLAVGVAGAANDERKTVIRLPDKRMREGSVQGKTSQVDTDLQFLKVLSGRLEGVFKRDAVFGLALLG